MGNYQRCWHEDEYSPCDRRSCLWWHDVVKGLQIDEGLVEQQFSFAGEFDNDTESQRCLCGGLLHRHLTNILMMTWGSASEDSHAVAAYIDRARRRIAKVARREHRFDKLYRQTT